jgi:hypothetical protein
MKYLNDAKPPDHERDHDLLAAELKKLEPLPRAQADAVSLANGELLTAMTQMSNAANANPDAPPQAVQAVQRATALFHAAHGQGGTIDAVAAWTRAGGQPEHDVWPQLAVPMFELNRQPPDLAAVKTQSAALKEISNRELDLARALILLARARLDLKDHDGADEALDKVLALRPEHRFAAELKRRVGESRLEDNLGKPPEAAPEAAP